jgi:hypothetical protein
MWGLGAPPAGRVSERRLSSAQAEEGKDRDDDHDQTDDVDDVVHG